MCSQERIIRVLRELPSFFYLSLQQTLTIIPCIILFSGQKVRLNLPQPAFEPSSQFVFVLSG